MPFDRFERVPNIHSVVVPMIVAGLIEPHLTTNGRWNYKSTPLGEMMVELYDVTLENLRQKGKTRG